MTINKKNKQSKCIKSQNRKIVCLLCLLCIIASLSGCSPFSFQAKKYVQSALDALCTENTESYQQMTNADEEEIKLALDASLQLQAEAYAAYFGIDALSDDTTEYLKEFARDIYQYCDYKVKRQKSVEDGFDVTVSFKPLLFHKLAAKEVKQYVENFNERAEDGEFLYQSDAAYQEKFVQGLLEVYEKEFDSISYGKQEKQTVHVEKKGTHYEMDLSELENQLVQFE